MIGRIAVPLLDGIAGAGEAQVAWVRALTGADEILLETRAVALPAEQATELIAAATERIGDQAPIAPALARELTAGDRERLLLACASATLGEEVDVVTHCPHPQCGELIELSVSLRDLLRAPDGGPRPPHHELTVRTPAGILRLRFRLPNGGDQEAAAHLALRDPAAAAALLAERCLLAVADEQSGAQEGAAGPEVAAALDEAIDLLDPAAETVGEGDCPACGEPVRTLLDGFALLSSGIASGDRLLAEIHSLARAYHWSEAEILSLPLPRRRRYLDLLQTGPDS